MSSKNAVQRHGDNVQVETTEDHIIIMIDRRARFGPSKSGKTNVVATTRGNVKVTPEGIRLGLNAYIYVEEDKEK